MKLSKISAEKFDRLRAALSEEWKLAGQIAQDAGLSIQHSLMVPSLLKWGGVEMRFLPGSRGSKRPCEYRKRVRNGT